jgi:hypothetical protein
MPARKQQNPLRVKASEYGGQQLEALGYAPRMEFELNDGSVVELVHPWLWSDEVQEAYQASETSREIARAVLGPDDHERFIAGGGKSNQIALAIEMMRRKITADAPDEADPKGK